MVNHSDKNLRPVTTTVTKFFDLLDKQVNKTVDVQELVSEGELKVTKSGLRCFIPGTMVPPEERSKGKFGSERLDANMDLVSMLVLDIDNMTEKKPGEPSRVIDNPVTLEDVKKVFKGCAWYFYSSVKYDPNVCLRGRVVIPLAEPIPAGQCRSLHHWANTKFEGRLDRKTSNPARIWYWPYAWPNHERNFMSVRNDGKLFRPKDKFYFDPGVTETQRKTEASYRDIRDPLNIVDRESREAVAGLLGAKVQVRNSGLVATGITCPKCDRDTVHFYIDAHKVMNARCNHEGHCGWQGPLSVLLKDVDLDDMAATPSVKMKFTVAQRMAWTAPAPHSATDIGRARRLRHYFADDLRFTPETGWMAWNGMWWEVDDADGAVSHRYYDLAIDTAFNEQHPMGSEISIATQDAEDEYDSKPTMRKPRDQFVMEAEVKARSKRDSEKDGKHIKSALEKASKATPFRIHEDQLNGNPLLLAFPNGTLDMESGQLRAPDPEDYITGGFDFDYLPEAECPVFESTLKLMIPQPAVRRYFQAVVGAALAYGNLTQEFYLLIGAGQNGKSTAMNAIQQAFGDYSTTLSAAVLQKGRSVSQNFDVMGLKDKRLALIPEWTESDVMDEGRMKALTGGDDIQAAKKGKDAITFSPSHTMFLIAQHTPRTLAQDKGTWRRMVVIPCDGEIRDSERRDVADIKKALKAETQGIITWMVEGMRIYQQGIERPEAVAKAMHPVEDWFEECCTKVEGAEVANFEAYADYSAWCRDCGSKPISKKGFLLKLREAQQRLGIALDPKRVKRKMSNGTRVSTYLWHGFTVREESNVVSFRKERTGRKPTRSK
jgi:putative DNA primase/helicase